VDTQQQVAMSMGSLRERPGTPARQLAQCLGRRPGVADLELADGGAAHIYEAPKLLPRVAAQLPRDPEAVSVEEAPDVTRMTLTRRDHRSEVMG
jgi:hypothetical protein